MSDIYTSIGRDYHPTDEDIEGFIKAIKGHPNSSNYLTRNEIEAAVM